MNEETKPEEATVSTPTKKRKKLKALVLVGALAVAFGGGGFLASQYLTQEDELQTIPVVEELPQLWEGSTITIPNVNYSGNPRYTPEYDGTDPQDLEEDSEGKLSEERSETLTIPITGECPVDENNIIGAPEDYTTGCRYEAERGGVAYLGHSVRGPRTGAFERVAELEVGDKVLIDDREFEVARVSDFPVDKLPDYLWNPGVLSLVTCTIDSQSDAGGDWTTDTVVSLKEVTN